MDEQAVRERLNAGDAVAVWIGDDQLPVGDAGNVRTDMRLLLTVLAAGGPAAAMLRAFGIDERAVRALDPPAGQ